MTSLSGWWSWRRVDRLSFGKNRRSSVFLDLWGRRTRCGGKIGIWLDIWLELCAAMEVTPIELDGRDFNLDHF
jgi:hypothetical protein